MSKTEQDFLTRLRATGTEIHLPDFTLPNDRFKSYSAFAQTLDRAKNMYSYAVKVNELDEKYGRIGPIRKILEDLSNQFPDSPEVHRCLGYFCWLAGDKGKASECYQKAADISSAERDWYDFAVLALDIGNHELAVSALEQLFKDSGVSANLNAWYIYLKLITKLSNFSFVANWLDTREENLTEQDTQILFDTSIYLLQITGNDSEAKDLMRKK